MALMLPKQRRRRIGVVVGINLVVIVVFAAVMLTVPTLTGQAATPAVLHCEPLSGTDNLSDYHYGWQIYECRDGVVTTSWENIYQQYLHSPRVLTVSADLKIVRQGIVYCGDLAAARGFGGWIKYRTQVIAVAL